MKELGEPEEEAEEGSLSPPSGAEHNVTNGRVLTMAGLFDIWDQGPEVGHRKYFVFQLCKV